MSDAYGMYFIITVGFLGVLLWWICKPAKGRE